MVFWRSWVTGRIRFTSSKLRIRNLGVTEKNDFTVCVSMLDNMPELENRVALCVNLA